MAFNPRRKGLTGWSEDGFPTENEFKALIGDYEKEPFKWTSFESKHQGSNDPSFEDNLIDLFSINPRRSGRTHIMVRAFVHISIMERRTMYIVDHHDSVKTTKQNDDNFMREVEKYVYMLKSEGVPIEFFTRSSNQFDVRVEAKDLDIYFKAREVIRERQPSFPNRTSATQSVGFTFLDLSEDKNEEILLIINKK